ncbi:MAG: gamma-glutamyltransferase [Candidatus Nealsonbacteria bacterium]|nr:gamma-glutamyltransferase [Candidatus Nealsonbacteria bacterium]
MSRRTQILVDTDQIELGGSRIVEPQRVAASKAGMVATAHHCATDVGRQILAVGGNAVDAAVAAALALGVCEPAACGLGGQTMMLIHLGQPRRTFALDGSSRAPNRATAEMFREQHRRLRGHAATTVPSTPAVLDYALREYGTMSFAAVAEPSIQLAEEGFPVSALANRLARRELKSLKTSAAGPLFLRDGVRPYTIGSTFRQPVLAKTLRRLARQGVKDFYQGRIARQIHVDMEKHDGLISRDDLAQIPQPIERRPVSCHFDGLRIITFPPPGAGRTLVEMLNILEHVPWELTTPDTPRGAVVLAEVIRRAFLDRRDRPFDPTFYAQVDHRRMVSAEYGRRVASRVLRRVRSHGDTTHLSVMDRFGNAVGLTQSIERVYGSCAAGAELGFLYNNYMSAFDYEDIAHPYYMRPNAAPWASVAPTIVFRGRRLWAVLGSPGSDRITPSIVQVLLRLKHQPPFDAVAAPRIHCRLNGEVSLEATRMRDDIPDVLRRHGFTVKVRDPYSFYLGCVQLVTYEKKTFIGVADPRRDGSAGGP